MRRFVTSVGAVLLSVALPPVSAAGAQPVTFRVEPVEGVTFSHTGQLQAGSEILLEVHNLPENQRFLANRCGPDCNTAETVFAVAGRDLDLMDRTFGIETTGRYYFYLQQRDESGAVGPVEILDVRNQDDGFIAEFAGGCSIKGSVRETSAPPPASPSDAPDGDDVEILAISPQTVTRGVPVELRVDVRVSLESAFEGQVGLGFNGQSPQRFAEASTRHVAAGTQQLTFITEVIPVDWGDRGRFSVSVYLLPREAGSGPTTPLAHKVQELEVVP